MSWPRSLFLLSIALVTFGGGLRAQLRIDLLQIELTGPTEPLRLHAGAGVTVVDISLDEGERRTLVVPLLARGGPGPDEEPELQGGGRLLPGSRSSAPPWRGVSPGLRARSLPTVGAARPGPGRPRLALLIAAALIALGLRRRPAGALAAGAAAAILMVILPAPTSADHGVRVLEFDRARGRSLEVLGGRDRVSLTEHERGWIRCLPSAEGLQLEVEVRGQESRWTARAPGARIFFQRELEGRLEEAASDLRLERVWLRRPGEIWLVQDGWNPAGSVPFEGHEGGPAPPGWLVSSLPQGVEVLLGEASGPDGRTTWVRAW